MKSKINFALSFALILFSFCWNVLPLKAQDRNSAVRISTTTKMIYHNGPVLTSSVVPVYIVWYGCWRSDCGASGSFDTQSVLINFVSNLGSTPYFQINSTYPNADGQSPSGAISYGGSAVQTTYTHGNELTDDDISGIIADQVLAGQLPLDPSSVYLVVTSSDISANAVGFCSAGTPPHHGYATVLGTTFRYGFVGNALRCPSVAAPQFTTANGVLLPTPNGDFAGDAMASDVAHVLSTMITNPYGSGWYDRYGLENADKCQGLFGPTYTTATGARANIRFGYRDYMVQQNWVNDKKGRCALSQ